MTAEITSPMQLHEVTYCVGGDGSSEWETIEVRADDNHRYWVGTDAGRDTLYTSIHEDMCCWDGPFTMEETIEELTYTIQSASRYCDDDDLDDMLNDLREYDDNQRG